MAQERRSTEGPTPDVPGDTRQPVNAPIDEEVRTEPLDLGEGDDVIIEQQNVGARNMRGGGEFPSRDAPPSDAAPGSLDDERRRHDDSAPGADDGDDEPGDAAARAGGPARQEQEPATFREAYQQTDPTDAGTRTTPE